MPGENIWDWSVTAVNNANSDSLINWAEGMARAAVNDSARSMMAATAKWRELASGNIATSGSPNAQAFTSGYGFTSFPPAGFRVTLGIPGGLTNTGPTTMSMDGLAAVAVQKEAGAYLVGGEIREGSYITLLWTGGVWRLVEDASKVNKIGDTMSGDLTVNNQVMLNATGSAASYFRIKTNSLDRWVIGSASPVGETGGNAGSDFVILNYNDAGTYIGNPFSIARSTGQTNINNLNVFGSAYVGGGLTVTPNLIINTTGYDPVLAINAPASAHARTQWTSGGRTWRAGCLASASFAISDETAVAVRLSIDTAGNITHGGPVLQGGIGINYNGVGGGNFHSFTFGAGIIYGVVDGTYSYPLANANSDRRLKQDIAPTNLDCLATINKLNVCEYRWLDHAEPGKPKAIQPTADNLVEAGLIAQDVYDVAWWLSRRPRGELVDPSPEKMVAWDLDQNNLIATLVGAVQQLTARIEALEAKLA